MNRRQFLRDSALASASVALMGATRFAAHAESASADSRIEVLLDEPLDTISPNIYGHFAENLSGVLYDGVWVGTGSKVPNIDGLRKDLLDQMRKIKAPVVRYPGGCFADSYDWQDGIGPPDQRPRRTNFWAGETSAKSPTSHSYDPNQVGTNEFVHFCRLIGAEPYLAANVRSLPPEAFYRWVEYCNSPAHSTTLADMRAKTGYAEPFHVRFWGVGNESWGCGGDFTPQEYAVEFRRYSSWLPSYGEHLSLVASGPSDDDWNWTHDFFEEIVRKGAGQIERIYGLALHHYAWNLSRGRTQDWVAGKGDALQFEAIDWYESLKQGDQMEALVTGHWQIMEQFDHDHHVKLVVDEWGPWYRPGSEATPSDLLEQTPTLRDAVFSAMTLDTFNRHPDKIAMANCAQLINCLNSLYLAHEDQFVVTPVGHVFEMYAPHQGGHAVRTIFSSPSVHYDRDGKPASFWGLKGSASLRDKDLTLTVVNPHVSDAKDTEIVVHGAAAKSGNITTLTHSDIRAHNTFQQREVVVPQTKALDVKGKALVLRLPPASVTSVQIQLV